MNGLSYYKKSYKSEIETCKHQLGWARNLRAFTSVKVIFPRVIHVLLKLGVFFSCSISFLLLTPWNLFYRSFSEEVSKLSVTECFINGYFLLLTKKMRVRLMLFLPPVTLKNKFSLFWFPCLFIWWLACPCHLMYRLFYRQRLCSFPLNSSTLLIGQVIALLQPWE